MRPCQACGKLYNPDLAPGAFRYKTLCPECHLKAVADQEARRIKDEQEALQRKADKRRAFISEHGWKPPDRFWEATLANFNAKLQPKACLLVKKFLVKPEKGILLYGPPGVGKTHLASAIFNHFYEKWDAKKRPVPMARFVREHDLFARIRATFGKSTRRYDDDEETETEDTIIQEYADASILIIDDLCKYTPADTSFRNRIYYELFDSLWNNQAILILTANIGADVLETELGSPIVDRIRDLCVLCEMKGVSQRGKEKPASA